MHEDLQAADRVRSVEKKSAAVRVTVQDCADLSYGEVRLPHLPVPQLSRVPHGLCSLSV